MSCDECAMRKRQREKGARDFDALSRDNKIAAVDAIVLGDFAGREWYHEVFGYHDGYTPEWRSGFSDAADYWNRYKSDMEVSRG